MMMATTTTAGGRVTVSQSKLTDAPDPTPKGDRDERALECVGCEQKCFERECSATMVVIGEAMGEQLPVLVTRKEVCGRKEGRSSWVEFRTGRRNALTHR
jgi:hypothetical protein